MSYTYFQKAAASSTPTFDKTAASVKVIETPIAIWDSARKKGGTLVLWRKEWSYPDDPKRDHVNYSYRGDGSSGGLRGQTDDEAIQEVEDNVLPRHGKMVRRKTAASMRSPPWYKAAEADDSLVKALLALHGLKGFFDSMEEIPSQYLAYYRSILKAADEVTSSRRHTYQLRMQTKSVNKTAEVDDMPEYKYYRGALK